MLSASNEHNNLLSLSSITVSSARYTVRDPFDPLTIANIWCIMFLHSTSSQVAQLIFNVVSTFSFEIHNQVQIRHSGYIRPWLETVQYAAYRPHLNTCAACKTHGRHKSFAHRPFFLCIHIFLQTRTSLKWCYDFPLKLDYIYITWTIVHHMSQWPFSHIQAHV